jgi:GMP synthase (glutamine-hydrolysing)
MRFNIFPHGINTNEHAQYMLTKILSVQNIECETLGLLDQMFMDDGYHIEKINAQNDAVPASPRHYDAIVILGGPMAVYENLPYLQNEQELIRNAIKNETPVLGICLGAQLIAQAAGGCVYKAKKKEIGWHRVYLTPSSSNDIFRGITDKIIRVFQWHGDTYDLPSNVKILAYSDLYPQAFRIGSAIGIQFHFEVDERLIRTWMKEYSADLMAENIRPESILPAPGDLEQLAAQCRMVYNNFARVLQK